MENIKLQQEEMLLLGCILNTIPNFVPIGYTSEPVALNQCSKLQAKPSYNFAKLGVKLTWLPNCIEVAVPPSRAMDTINCLAYNANYNKLTIDKDWTIKAEKLYSKHKGDFMNCLTQLSVGNIANLPFIVPLYDSQNINIVLGYCMNLLLGRSSFAENHALTLCGTLYGAFNVPLEDIYNILCKAPVAPGHFIMLADPTNRQTGYTCFKRDKETLSKEQFLKCVTTMPRVDEVLRLSVIYK